MIDSGTVLNSDEKDFGDGVFFCAEGLVAKNDDPENRCRIQCSLPIFDDDVIHEVWARRVNLHVGENGFGDYFIPAIGSAVVVWGRLGDTHNLFYAPLWNESRRPSSEFSDKSISGIKVSGVLKFIAGQLAKILAQTVEIIAEQSAKLKGSNATVEATQTALLKGNQVNVNGTTITIQSNGSVLISGNNVQITGSSVRLHNRIVNPAGPAI